MMKMILTMLLFSPQPAEPRVSRLHRGFSVDAGRLLPGRPRLLVPQPFRHLPAAGGRRRARAPDAGRDGPARLQEPALHLAADRPQLPRHGGAERGRRPRRGQAAARGHLRLGGFCEKNPPMIKKQTKKAEFLFDRVMLYGHYLEERAPVI